MDPARIIVALEPSPGTIGEELPSRGVAIERVYGPDEVVDVLDRGTFDLCLVFAGDPRTEEVLQQLRAAPAGAVMPVLIVGGERTGVTDRERALELGADAFVDEAEGRDELLSRVEMLLGRPSKHPDAPVAASDPVEEALGLAAAVAPVVSQSGSSDRPAKVAVGDVSVQQIIDRIEARISTQPPAGTDAVADAGDPLDGVDIEADLGRPVGSDSAPPDAPTAAADAAEAPAGAPPDDAADETTLAYVPESDDDPTLPGTPAGVRASSTAAADSEGDGPDQPEEETTLTDVPAENPLAAFELEAEEATPPPAGRDGGAAPVADAAVRSTRLNGGSLERDPLWSLLALALAERASGALLLSSRGVERKVFVHEGEPVMAVSSAREDRLIELLYREGRLSEDQYQQAVMTIGASGRRAGVILMEKGLISPRELFPLVRHHYETLIFDAFDWREGTWSFDPRQRAKGERILLDVPAGSLIVEGIRLRGKPADIDALILPDAIPLRAEEGLCPLEKIDLPPEELGLVAECDGVRSIAELARSYSMPEEEVRTLLAGLVVLGWIRPIGGSDRDASARAMVHAPSGLASEARVDRARVADKLAQVEEGTYFAIMEISPEASGYEIRKSYRRLRGQFARSRFAVAELADLQREVEVIRFVLDEAYEVLRDPAQREVYRQALAARS